MYSLRWYQDDSCKAAWDFLCTKPGNPVICLPTGAGKSLVIADLCREAVTRYHGRVLVLAHRKELLEQNAEKVLDLLPDMDIGIYSAGLKSRDTDHDIVVAGIQSVFKRALEFGRRHLVLIDEVHLVPHDGEGMYRTFLEELRSVNPQLRMVGLTATPYRLDVGPLCRPDALFQKVCYSAPVQQLIEEGFLCRLTTKPAQATVDTSNLKLRGGEFIQHDAIGLFDTEFVVNAACREIAEKTQGRHSVLVFCSGVDHAEHVASQLERLTGHQVGIVTGNTMPLEREATLEAFKTQRLRFLCNVDVLTTGFDAPCVDAIAVLRATMSPGLFAQICGRGFRVHASKTDCLVLDFGENIKRHGPLDSPAYGKSDKRQANAGEAPTKVCPNCQAECGLGVAECQECGWLFPREREPRHGDKADGTEEILVTPKRWSVEEVKVRKHYKRGDPSAAPTFRIDYGCQIPGESGNLLEWVSEWVCVEHDGYALRKAMAWWKEHSLAPLPRSVDEAIDLWQRGAIVAPRVIVTVPDGKFKRIVAREVDELPETWSDEAVEDPFASASVEEEPF